MKRCFAVLSIAVLLYPFGLSGQNPCASSPSYRTERLLGPVKSVTTEAYRVTVDGEQLPDGLAFYRTYTTQQCLATSIYDVYLEGDWLRTCLTTYDSLSQRILEKECGDGTNLQRWRYNAIAGTEGRFEGVLIEGEEEFPQNEVLQYENDHIVYKEAFIEPYFLVTHYDEWRRATRHETYTADRELTFSWERKFEHNEIVEEVQYAGAISRIDKRLVYEHDTDQRITKEVMYQQDGSHASTTTYYYSDIGLLLRVEKDYTSLSVEDDLTVYDYDYDEWGNWTMRRKVLNGRFVNLEKRTLTYY